MGRQRKARPDGCVIYESALRQALLLPDDSAGKVIKAAARLFLAGEEPEDFELSEAIVFSLFRDNIAESLDKFRERCARNKENAERCTTGCESLPAAAADDERQPGAPIEENRTEQNRIEKNQTEESGTEENAADKPRRAARFSPPSFEDVSAYCLERRNGVDARRFVDFYASKGWKIGKETMKDWRAAIRTWESRDRGKDIRSPDRYAYSPEDSL